MAPVHGVCMAAQPICCLEEVDFISCIPKGPQSADARDAATNNSYTFSVHLLRGRSDKAKLGGEYTSTLRCASEEWQKASKTVGKGMLQGMKVLMSLTRKRIRFQLV